MPNGLLSLGVNKTPLSPTTLRFAERDAARFGHVFTSSRAPFRPEDARVLLGDRANLRDVRSHLDMLALFPPRNFVMSWAGHGGSDGIALADGLLSYAELGERVERIDARTKMAFFGTCHAGGAERMFEERVAGLAGLDFAWSQALQAACPGLRVLMAVGRNQVAYDDPKVQSSRFHFALFRALTCLPGDIAHNGFRWISDAALVPRLRAIIGESWPGEALPYLVGPTGACGKLP
jgi:hypothetical protein